MRTLRLMLAAAIVAVATVVFASPSPAYVAPANSLQLAMQVTPSTASVGQSVTVSITVTNTSLVVQSTTAVVKVVPPKVTAMFGPRTLHVPFTVQAQASTTKSVQFKLPASAPKGVYSATLTAQGSADTVVATFTVT